MKTVSYLTILFIFALKANVFADTKKSKVAKNLIYFVGDGMGPAQITGARYFKYGPKGKLNLEKMPFTGISKTYSTQDFVTDSAAAATALLTGVKTYNNSIGKTDPSLDPTGKSRDLQSLLDLALKAGKSVGIVSTARVTHATPASLFAHVKNRGEENEIATQVQNSSLTLLMGGGKRAFLPKEYRDKESGKKGKRKDSRNIVNELQGKGWTYVQNKKELMALDPHKKNLKVLGLFEMSHMKYEIDRPSDKAGEPSLKELTTFALSLLSKNPKGYFLFVEGGRIDHAAHDNDARRTFTELLEMDKAIGHVLKTTNDETLFVVTADHETSGLSILGYGNLEEGKGEQLLKPTQGFLKKDDGHATISWGSGPGSKKRKKKKKKKKTKETQRSTYYRSSGAHSAVDVIVAAKGPGANIFSGFMMNSEIPLKIAKAMGWAFTSKINLENQKAMDKANFH